MTSIGPAFLPCTAESIGSMLPRIAIGFTVNEIEGRLCSHAVILFRHNTGPVVILDLHLDGDVHSKPVDPTRSFFYSWAIPAIPEPVLNAMTWFCEAVAKRSDHLGYWFEYGLDEVLIDDGTTIQLSDRSIGLTCATFVLAVFECQGFKLLDLDVSTGCTFRTSDIYRR